MDSLELFLAGLEIIFALTTSYVLTILFYTLATGTFTKIK